MTADDAARDAAFAEHRDLVLRLAYDVTGSWADAEDVAQHTWLRWRGVTGEVGNPRAYLARICTHAALDVVAQRDRVGYPGPFLPEPVETGPGADAAVERAAEVEIALMVVLGTLTPLERAAFLLHDVFAFTHAEVADMLDREPAAVRQLASRARRHVVERRPAPDDLAVDAQQLAVLTERFLGAAREGDLEALGALLTEDVVFVGDGGGRVRSTRRPVEGRDRVARLLLGLVRTGGFEVQFEVVEVNRRPAVAIYDGERLDQVLWLMPRDGQVAQLLTVRNPDKLRQLAARG